MRASLARSPYSRGGAPLSSAFYSGGVDRDLCPSPDQPADAVSANDSESPRLFDQAGFAGRCEDELDGAGMVVYRCADIVEKCCEGGAAERIVEIRNGHIARDPVGGGVGGDELDVMAAEAIALMRDVGSCHLAEVFGDLDADHTTERIAGCAADDPPLAGAEVDEHVSRRNQPSRQGTAEPGPARRGVVGPVSMQMLSLELGCVCIQAPFEQRKGEPVP